MASTLRLIPPVRCPVVIAAAIPDAMLLPTDECFAQELMAGQGTEVTTFFGGRRLLLLNDEAWRCHPYTQALKLVGGCRNGGQQLVARRL
jgi:hypothetical protein